MSHSRALYTGTIAALGLIAGTVNAQTFPTKPLRIIVPFAPGGTADTSARQLAEHLGKPLGQPVIVDNRPGAGAVIGYELGAKAPPDGHTLLIVYPSFVINPSVRKVQYDPQRDFRAVTQIISLPMSFAVHPSLPVNTFKDYAALARAKPGEITYGTPGVGTTHHVLAELAALSMKGKLTHVPYSGGAPAITALAGGHVTSVCGNVSEMVPFAKSNRIRVLVVTSAKRSESLPEVPTMRESGFPDLEATNWSGIVVPAATPAAAVTRLNTELVRALGTTDIRDKFRTQEMAPEPSTAEQFAGLLQSESARYSKVVKAAGIRAE